jgi:hypothetical protein
MINYMGDYDDLNEVNLIGPYPDGASAAADAARLQSLPGVFGLLEFVPSDLSASHMTDPQGLKNVANAEEIMAVVFKY